MITVDEALDALFALARPLATERVRLAEAAGRVLAEPVVAERNQPPFAAAAMDGYALKGIEAEPGAMFKVIGTSVAGARFEGTVGAGQAVRIFTGAPVPIGADRVIIQEDVDRDGDLITLHPDLDRGPYVRPLGMDFAIGATLTAPRVLGARDLALIAAMNHAEVTVTRRPEVALIATGDELVMPGETPGPDQIIASNAFGLKAMVERTGARGPGGDHRRRFGRRSRSGRAGRRRAWHGAEFLQGRDATGQAADGRASGQCNHGRSAR
jgi:molybdopterin molybdotransferase